MQSNMSRRDILKMVEAGSMSPAEAFRRLKELGPEARAGAVPVVGATAVKVTSPVNVPDNRTLSDMLQQDLLDACSEVMKVERSKIHPDKNIAEYGFDSISLTMFNSYINEKFGFDISPKAFADNPTISLLTQFLLEEFKDVLVEHYKAVPGNRESAGEQVPSPAVVMQYEEQLPQEDRNFLEKIWSIKEVQFGHQPIWVIDAERELSEEKFINFWSRLQRGEFSPLKLSNVTKEFLDLIMEKNSSMVHLLVEISSGKRIEVVSAGSGRPVVIIGGTGMAAAASVFQIRDWSSRNRVIVIHAPGCGLSEEIRDLSLPGIAAMVREVLNVLGVEKPVHMMGISWGTMVCQTFVHLYPQEAASLIMVGGMTEYVNSHPDMPNNEQMNRDLEKSGHIEYSELIAKSISSTAEVYPKYMRYYDPCNPEYYNTSDIISRIEVPTLIIQGKKDFMIDPGTGRMLHEKMPGSQYYEIPDAGHFLFMTHHSEFNKRVAEFIEEQEERIKPGKSGRTNAAQTKKTVRKKFDFNIGEYENMLALEEKKIEQNLGMTGIGVYGGFESELNELCASYIYEYIKSSGVNISKGSICSKEGIKKALKIIPKFEKFYNFFVLMLEEDGILRTEGDRIEFLKDADEIPNPSIMSSQMQLKYPEFQGMYQLLEHCSKHYNKALSGEMFAISVLLPKGRPNFLMECLNNTAEFSNEKLYSLLTGEMIGMALKKLGGKRKMRILEIGGGQGLLTREIAPVIDVPEVEYYFTDIGDQFVKNMKAENIFKHVKYGLLDISKDPGAQGFENNSFDMVLGLNVVHATPNVGDTIRNLKKLLVPNGAIALIEIVRSKRWHNMIWGFAEGWWYYDDTYIRQGSPLITLEKWSEVFAGQGFKSVKTFPKIREKTFILDSGMIVAQ